MMMMMIMMIIIIIIIIIITTINHLHEAQVFPILPASPLPS